MASVSTEALESLIAGETAVAVPELGRHWVEQFQQTPGVAAVLCYGSGLRETLVDPDEVVFDFYLLVQSYRDFDPKRGLALAGALIPPNVYYREEKIGDRTLRCKFAVLTVSQFSAAARGRSFTPHIWARFCQPSRIVYTADEGLRRDLVAAMAESVLVFHRRTLHLIENCTLADFWRAGLHSTYADEIRSEKKGRMQSVFDANAAAYTARTRLALDLCSEMGRMAGSDSVHSGLPTFSKQIYRLRLRLKRPLTKGVVILRFIKAAFTFQGGLEYARWKIERHSGMRIEISDFQRRHPLLGGLSLFWKVMRQGGLR